MNADRDNRSADFIDLRQLSQFVSLSPRTIRQLVHNPEDPLPAYRLHGKFLFRYSEVTTWIEKHRVEPFDPKSIADDIVNGMSTTTTSCNTGPLT